MGRIAFFLLLIAGGAARCLAAGQCPGPNCDQEPVMAFGADPGAGQGQQPKKDEKKKEESGGPPQPQPQGSPPSNKGGGSNNNNQTPPKTDDRDRSAPPDLTVARPPIDSEISVFEGYDPATGKLMCYATQTPQPGHCPD